MPLDETPQGLREWMRQIAADVAQLKRHTHPNADPASLPALEARVSVLEGQMEGVLEDVDALEQAVLDLGLSIFDLNNDIDDIQNQINYLYDNSGFVAFTPATTGWTWNDTSGYRKTGLFVTLNLSLSRSVGAGVSSTAFTISSLPPAFRPLDFTYIQLYNSTSGATGQDRRGTIDPNNGVISVTGSADTTVGEGNSLTGTVTYARP